MRFILLFGLLLSTYTMACEDDMTPVFTCALADESEVTLCGKDKDNLRFRIQTKEGEASVQDFPIAQANHFEPTTVDARGLMLSNDALIIMIAQQYAHPTLPRTIIKVRGFDDEGIKLVCAAGSDSDLTPEILARYGGTPLDLTPQQERDASRNHIKPAPTAVNDSGSD